MVALLPISSHPQQQQQPHQNDGSATNSEQQKILHQTLTHSRLTVLHSSMAQTGSRPGSLAPPNNQASSSVSIQAGRTSSPLPQEVHTLSTQSSSIALHQGGPLFTARTVSAVPSNTASMSSLPPYPIPGVTAQAATQGGSRSSPLPRGTRAASPPTSMTDRRRGGASSSSYSEGYGSTEGGPGRATCGPDLLRSSVRESGPARQRNDREGERQLSKDLPASQKTMVKRQTTPPSCMDGSSHRESQAPS